MYILQYTVCAIDIAYGWKIKHERSRDRQGTKTRSSVIENVRVPTNRERLVRASFAIIHPKVARMPPHRDTCQVQIDGNENNGRRSLWKKSMQFSSTCNRIFRPFNFMRSRVSYVNRSTGAYRFEYRARKSNNAGNARPPVPADEFSRVQRSSILCEKVVQNVTKCR